jgi:hypothetical protein
VLTYKRSEDIYRAGVNRANVKLREGPLGTEFPTTYPFVTLGPGIGYYQVDPSLPGPGVPFKNSLTYWVYTIGADVGIGGGLRIVSELAKTVVPDTDISAESNRGYVSLLKRADKWTPYITYAFLRSRPTQRNLYLNVNYRRCRASFLVRR